MGEFIDMQAEIGISKHLGGFASTRRMLELCHADSATEVLDVGCGIGVGPAFVARTYGCHVTGVDLSPKMIEWARRRVDEEGVGARVTLRQADVLALPFEDGRFDVVTCESVLAFVEDKAAAIAELVRVTRPGGYVGLNEGLWGGETPPEAAETVRRMGAEILTLEAWRELWHASGLEDRVVQTGRLDPAVEVRRRIRWIGLRWMVAAWGRGILLLLTRPDIRRVYATIASGGKAFESSTFGLFVGRKSA